MKKAVGIVSEFNPFHFGHAHLLSEVKKAHGASNKSTVKKGLLDLSVELVNNIAMHIYCYNVEIER